MTFLNEQDNIIKCLDAIPSLKLRFGEMANLYPRWKTLVDNWETLPPVKE